MKELAQEFKERAENLRKISEEAKGEPYSGALKQLADEYQEMAEKRIKGKEPSKQQNAP